MDTSDPPHGSERGPKGPSAASRSAGVEEIHPRPDNIAWLVFRAARRWPASHAIAEGDRTITYEELFDRVSTYAEDLGRLGVGPGDRVGILSRRTWEVAAAFFGIAAVGAVGVILPETSKRPQIDHVLGDSGAVALLTTPDDPARAFSIRRLDPQARPGPRPGRAPLRGEVGGDDLAQLIYTSGSSGRPKGVMVSHANLMAGTMAVTDYLGVRAEDRIAGLLPFSFDYGLNQVLVSVANGACLVIARSPLPARIDRALRSHGVTIAAGVPLLWQQLLSSKRFCTETIPSLRLCTNSGGRLPAAAVRQLRAAQPQAELYLMYGLTEAFRSTYLHPSLVEAKPGSVGKAIPGAQVQVINPDGEPCGPREIGEITHRGPTVTHGYWNDPDATQRVFRPASSGGRAHDTGPTVHSGDLGWIDEDGDLYIAGRRDRMVKRLGHRVNADEITDALFDSGLVVEACVTIAPGEPGAPGGAGDVVVVGHVVLKPSATTDAVEAHLRREWPRHLWPSQITSHRKLPVTGNGKPDVCALGQMTA